MNPTLQCPIEQVADWHPRLFLEPHIVACVAVLSRFSSSPTAIDVECVGIRSKLLARARGCSLVASWLPETQRKADGLRLTMQPKPLVEMAAIAVAMVLASQVIHLGQLEVTRYGDGADYRSLTARKVLEASGTEVLAELGRRHRDKAAQALGNPFGWDAYVIVCAFCGEGHRARFSYHPWEETSHG